MNSKIIKEHYLEDNAPVNYSVFLKRKIGRGANTTYKYHNFTDGKEYDSIEEVAALGDCIIVKKESNSDKKEVINGHTILLKHTKQSDFIATSYNVVEYEGEKFFVIYIISLDIRSTLNSDDERREWKLLSKCYIDSKKFVYPDSNFCWYHGRGFEACSYKDLSPVHNWTNIMNINYLSAYSYADEQRQSVLSKMGWGVVTLGNNVRRPLVSGWSIVDFLKYKEPTKKNGPKQRHIDELVSLKIEDIVAPKMKKIPENLEGWRKSDFLAKLHFANISKVENGDTPTCCYRTFVRLEDGSYSEGGRIYIEPNGKFTACKKNNIGEWVNMSLSVSNENFNYKINYINNDSIKGTVLEYLIPMLKDVEGEEVGTLIAASLRHPCIEKIYKAGFAKSIENIAKSYHTSFWEGVISNFGAIDENAKNIYSLIGLNKKQLSLVCETAENHKYYKGDENKEVIPDAAFLIKNLKHVFNSSNITSIDDETFKEMLQMIVDVCEYDVEIECVGIYDSQGTLHKNDGYYWARRRNQNYIFDSMNIIASCFPITTVRSMIPKLSWLYKQFEEKPEKRYQYEKKCYIDVITIVRPISTYWSYLEMLNYLPERTGLSPHFQGIEHIKIMHDDILPIHRYYQELERAKMNEERLKAMQEKWDSCKRTWKKWEYNDEEYAIIYPEEPYKLTVEGASLGHCVGGYIQKVVNRTTNILFLRKASELDKPFFTIEILTNGSVEQIHGRSNCNIADPNVLKEEPNLVAFVNKWAIEKGLSLNNINKVR